MAGFVLDCSVTMSWYLEDEKTEFTERLLAQVGTAAMVVPALWRIEFVNAMLVAARRGRISEAWRDSSIAQAAALPIQTDASLIGLAQLRGLALQYGLTPYDASYLELAQRRRLTLATLDEDLVRAAQAAGLPHTTDVGRFPTPPPRRPRRRERR